MLRDVKTGKIKLAALSQRNKDSVFAMYVAATFGWDIACVVAVESANSSLIPRQAEAMALPLIVEKSSGEKLGDYYEAIKKAKEQYHITGVIVSEDYETVSKICKELQLRMFAPLLQKNPILLLKEMIEMGMDMRISNVKTEVLGEQWLGKKLDSKAYEELMQLHNRIGFNPVEGYESSVLYCPVLFKKQLTITKAEKIMESESIGTYTMEVALT
jgi:uncharacterized protein (TIGR00290 family)